MLFSERLFLAESVQDYMTEHHIRKDALGVITTLQIWGIIDDEKATELIKKMKEEKNEKDTDAV